jgi:Ser/Thr protein kinase RdoA (MazF antagonist)
MSTHDHDLVRTLCDAFGIQPVEHDIVPYGSGLVNRTFLLKDRVDGDHWMLQQVNTAVFKRPELIAFNNYLAAEHLRSHHPGYRFMRGRRTADGKDLFQHPDPELGVWRVFPYFTNTVSYDQAVTPAQAFTAAQQFGRLTRKLDGVYVGAFQVIIPGFHDTAERFSLFQASIGTATPDRREQAHGSIDFFLSRAHIVEEFNAAMADPDVRTRITHNDTKLNNVLFDKDSGEAVCVVDLDTLMPGKAIFDLGDMIRTFISTASEDDPDPAHTRIDADVFEQLVRGWNSEMAPLLSNSEKALLYWSGQLLMFEQGIRFLTDFLQGDVYYRTTRPGHNLDRAMNQMFLLKAYEERRGELESRLV